MAIHYPAGIVYRQINFDTKAGAINELIDVLDDAGWTKVEEVVAWIAATFNGLPNNNNSATIDGLTYTFVTTLVQATPRQVKIGATAAETASNFGYAIIAGAGSGTAYSSSTVAHPTCTATLSAANQVKISYKTAGSTGIGITVTSAVSNVTFASVGNGSGSLGGGGYKYDCVETGHGLQARLYIFDPGGAASGNIAIKVTTVDEVWGIDGAYLLVATARKLQVRAHAHGLWTFVIGSFTGSSDFAQFQFEVPWLLPPNRPAPETRAGFGDMATIHQAFWWRANRTFATGAGVTWYDSFRWTAMPSGGSNGLLNEFLSIDANVGVCTSVVVPDGASYANWEKGAYDLMEARIGWRVNNASFFKVGELWGAFVIATAAPGDLIKTGFDGHDWISYTQSNVIGNHSIWLAIS